jgi:hypothetical protein
MHVIRGIISSNIFSNKNLPIPGILSGTVVPVDGVLTSIQGAR